MLVKKNEITISFLHLSISKVVVTRLELVLFVIQEVYSSCFGPETDGVLSLSLVLEGKFWNSTTNYSQIFVSFNLNYCRHC